MKKHLILALSALSLCILTGCASIDITINKKGDLLKDIEKASECTNIYDKYGNFRIDVLGTHADNTADDYSIYYSDNSYIVVNRYGTTIDDHGDVYGYDTEMDAPFRYIFFDDAYETYKKENEMVKGFGYSETEKIISREEKDGKIFLQTEDTPEAIVYILESWGFDPDTVERTYAEYIIDSDTLIAQNIKAYAVVDGKKVLYSDTTISPDNDGFVPDKVITDAISSNDNRTITVITDPGSADERSFSETIIKGGVCFIPYPSGYEPVLYDDSECTVIHQPSPDRNSDMTLYMKRSGENQ